MTSDQVRFGILGFGHHAVRRLLPAFARAERATLHGAWRRDRAAADRDCAQFAIAHCFTTAEELCASPEIDAVLITSPDALHRADALLAIAHRKAVLCEKPLAMNAREAGEMADAAARAGVLFGVAQNFRYNRSLERMRSEIASGRIGTVQTARAEFVYSGDKAPRKWIADPKLACGGPIGDVGIHCVDALRYVLGEEVVSVSTLARRDATSGPVEAAALLSLEMSGDVYASVAVSARGLYRTLIEVTGSEGALVAENGFSVDRPIELLVRRSGELAETIPIDNADAYARMLDAFAAAHRGGEPYRGSGADGVRNMRVLDAAYASWQSGARELV